MTGYWLVCFTELRGGGGGVPALIIRKSINMLLYNIEIYNGKFDVELSAF